MPQSLVKVLIHMVWSTKHRTPWLRDKQVQLYPYMATVLGNMDSPALVINGVEDHVGQIRGRPRTASQSSQKIILFGM